MRHLLSLSAVVIGLGFSVSAWAQTIPNFATFNPVAGITGPSINNANTAGSPTLVNGNGGSIVFPPFNVNAPVNFSFESSTRAEPVRRSTTVRYEPIYVDRGRSTTRSSYSYDAPVYRPLNRSVSYPTYYNTRTTYRPVTYRPVRAAQYEVQYVTVLPHTGIDTFTGALGDATVLSPVTQNATAAMATFWSIAASGIGAGVAAGRKFLFA